MPKVSVIITAYNAMPYLSEAVESTLKQTFTDFEVLIIDDGSSDRTIQWASQLVDPRVKLISQQNQGVSVARNTGIAHARGEYVAFLDGDDIWEATKLEKQVRCLENNPAVGLVHTWSALIDERSKPTGRVMTSNAKGDVWKQLVERNTVACSSAMVRRCCFDTVGVFEKDLRVAEDWDMWIRIAACYPFATIKEPLIRYRLHPHSKSKNYPARLQDFCRIIERAFQATPFELLHLRNRSYGRLSLTIAWKCLQSSDGNYKQADRFRCQALMYYPQLCCSREYIRLSLAIAAMYCLKPDGYGRALALVQALKRHTSIATKHLLRLHAS